MDNEKIKRVNIRINTEDYIDKVVWDYIKNEKKKGTFIKKLIYDMATNKLEIDKNIIKERSMDLDEEDLDSSGMEGF